MVLNKKCLSAQKLINRTLKANSLLCVGLDSDFTKLPEKFRSQKHPQFAFNKWIIEQTATYVCAYKPNFAFYESRGDQGIKELKMTVEFLQEKYPDIFLIADAKRGDIGSTNEGYVKEIFDWFGFDAVTLHPYLGKEALQPFLDRKDKVSIILCRTSNPGAGEFQDLETSGEPLWKKVAKTVAKKWNENKNCMLVVGATYPSEMKEIRKVTNEMTFLVPGIGAQGGEVKAIMKSGLNSQRKGMMINSARGIIFDKNPQLAAKELQEQINTFR